ncbi:MAG: galactose mutarotase [Bacteroidales bacterium]|nr:galactose mutarotase [Bacteroidales bacterium]
MRLSVRLGAALAALSFLAGCTGTKLTDSGLNPKDFKTTVDGAETALYTLRNARGAEVCITNFGARIVSLRVPDKDGNFRDVVLGFDNIQDYINVPSDFGATIGRYANRIGDGRFTLDGKEYDLPKNNFGHCLHGGPKGWQYAVYEATHVSDQSVTLKVVSPDGDQGFPGKVTASVKYTLTNDNRIMMEYSATTDAPTVINMTNHSYFNLAGDPANHTCEDDVLWIAADYFTPVDDTFMTSGELRPVAGTPMDFRFQTRVGDRINQDYDQLVFGKGIDHNWVLDTHGRLSTRAAQVYCPESGIILDVYTDQPGIQVYCGNFLDGTVTGKGGIAYPFRAAICMETQHYPDSPNKPEWPSVVLRPGERYRSTTVFAFSTK